MTVETLFETERLRLTSWADDQLAELAALHRIPDVARFLSTDGAPWPEEKLRTRLAMWQDQFAREKMGKLRVIRRADNVFLGRAGFGIFTPTGEREIGYSFFPRYWGNGYAREAAAGLRDWLFAETDHDHFIGLADMRNLASRRVLKAIGMLSTHQETEPDGQVCQFYRIARTDLVDG